MTQILNDLKKLNDRLKQFLKEMDKNK